MVIQARRACTEENVSAFLTRQNMRMKPVFKEKRAEFECFKDFGSKKCVEIRYHQDESYEKRKEVAAVRTFPFFEQKDLCGDAIGVQFRLTEFV